MIGLAPYGSGVVYGADVGPSFVEALKLPSQLVSWNLNQSPTPSSITFGGDPFINTPQYTHSLTSNSTSWTIQYYGLSYGT